MQVNLIISTKDTANKNSSYTVRYVNPNATNSKLRELAIALTELTTDNFQSVKKQTTDEILN